MRRVRDIERAEDENRALESRIAFLEADMERMEAEIGRLRRRRYGVRVKQVDLRTFYRDGDRIVVESGAQNNKLMYEYGVATRVSRCTVWVRLHTRKHFSLDTSKFGRTTYRDIRPDWSSKLHDRLYRFNARRSMRAGGRVENIKVVRVDALGGPETLYKYDGLKHSNVTITHLDP